MNLPIVSLWQCLACLGFSQTRLLLRMRIKSLVRTWLPLWNVMKNVTGPNTECTFIFNMCFQGNMYFFELLFAAFITKLHITLNRIHNMFFLISVTLRPSIWAYDFCRSFIIHYLHHIVLFHSFDIVTMTFTQDFFFFISPS